jgi:site-specific recombinase XerD
MIRLQGKPLDAITKADIEAVRQERRTHGVVGTNRLLARLRHLFNWAIGEGYIDKTPFKRGGVSVVKLERRLPSSRVIGAWRQSKRRTS